MRIECARWWMTLALFSAAACVDEDGFAWDGPPEPDAGSSAAEPAAIPPDADVTAPSVDAGDLVEPSIPAAPQPKPFALDECGLDTGWPGDEYCILPPPPDKGFQIHFGPESYDDPAPEYVLQPGQEYTHEFRVTSPNDRDVQFYFRQYRMRPGAHHTIVRDTTTGRRLSGANVSQDHPVGGIIAPENEGIGIPMAAHVPISANHHAINVTEEPLLQEVWVNFWYVDPSEVTETTTLLWDPGDVMASVAPMQDVVIGPYECDIQQPGRLISMFGHVHANNVRFSAWRTRAGQRDLIYDSYDWEDPLWAEFTSLAQNVAPDPANHAPGAWSGILDLQAGDTLMWECHEINQRPTTLRFTNATYDGMMCIIIGELVGTRCMTRSATPIAPTN